MRYWVLKNTESGEYWNGGSKLSGLLLTTDDLNQAIRVSESNLGAWDKYGSPWAKTEVEKGPKHTAKRPQILLKEEPKT